VLAGSLCYPLLELLGLPGLRVLPLVAALKVAALKVAGPLVAALKVAGPLVAALKVARAIPLSHVRPRFVAVPPQTARSLSEVSKALTPAGREVPVGVGPCDTHLRQREYSQASQVECLA